MITTDSRVGAVARMKGLFAVLAIMALPVWGCSDAGDSPAAPGDGGPNGDSGESSLSASINDGVPGGLVDISGTYRDGNGNTVDGVAILASAEGYGAYFSFVTNPTYTDANGKFSIDVNIADQTPPGSYTLLVQTSFTYNAPMTKEYLHMKVVGASIPAEVTLSASSLSVESGQSVTFTVSMADMNDCTPVFEYSTSGTMTTGWTQVVDSGNTQTFKLSPTTDGSLQVMARGTCAGATDVMYSDTVTVTVAKATLPTVTGVTLTATPTSVVGGNTVIFTVSVTKDADCTLRINTKVNGNTYSDYTNGAWSTTSGGTYSLPTFVTGTTTSLVIASEAYCTENSSDRKSATVTVTVTP